MEVRRNLAVLQGQDDLQQAGDAGRRLEVSDVGLDRSDGQRRTLPLGSLGIKHLGQSLHFDGVAQRRAGPVSLEVPDLVRPDAAVLQRLLDQGHLGRSVGGRQPVAAAVVVDGRAAEEGQDPVAVGEGIVEAFQHDHAATFAPHVTVRRLVEGVAGTAGGEGPGGREGHAGGGIQDQVDPPRQGRATLALPQALCRQVHSDQGRAAGGVDGQGGTVQPQEIGHPASRHAVQGPGAGMGIDPLHTQGPVLQPAVIAVGDPHEDPGVGPGQPLG